MIVNIDISDINDNPPTFSPANHTAVIQVHCMSDAQLALIMMIIIKIIIIIYSI